MSKDTGSSEAKGEAGDVVRLTAAGHEAMIDRSGKRPQVTIDGRPVAHGTDAAGKFYLTEYAFDRGETLEEVVERYLSYLERIEARSEP